MTFDKKKERSSTGKKERQERKDEWQNLPHQRREVNRARWLDSFAMIRTGSF
jgi:hypothetical protein